MYVSNGVIQQRAWTINHWFNKTDKQISPQAFTYKYSTLSSNQTCNVGTCIQTGERQKEKKKERKKRWDTNLLLKSSIHYIIWIHLWLNGDDDLSTQTIDLYVRFGLWAGTYKRTSVPYRPTQWPIAKTDSVVVGFPNVGLFRVSDKTHI